MNVTSQGYPLIAETDTGDTFLVVGWTPAADGGLVPVVVREVGHGRPFALPREEVSYRLPAEAPARAH